MLRKLFTISFLLILTSMMFAQERAILKPNGEVLSLKAQGSLMEAIRVSGLRAEGMTEAQIAQSLSKSLATEDTLSYTDYPGWAEATKYRFGYDPLDVMVQWYVAPTDLNINAIGFNTNTLEADYDENSTVEMKLVKLNWDADKITGFESAAYLGYYEAEGYVPTPIAPFQDDEVVTGGWVDKGSAPDSPFGEDIWSDEGFGAPTTPILGGYQWVEMNLLDYEPPILEGEIFGIVLKNISPLETPRLDVYTAAGIGIPGFKFYAQGRLVTDPTDPNFDPGWWIRTAYTWDIVAAVTYTGDTPPKVEGVTSLPTTLSTDARTVEATITDENPSGGAAGIASATLKYSVDGGTTWADVAMTASGDLYSADIPGQSPGTTVHYKIVAEDVGGKVTETVAFSYKIYLPTEGIEALLVFNGLGDAGYPQDYYFRQWPGNIFYDKWAYGPLTSELVENYKYVFEICTDGPLAYNREVIADWLAVDPTRSYFLAGEEWLGADNGYTDMTYEAGSFEYDVLGLAASYNDITFDGTSGQELPSLIFAEAGSVLGGDLATAAAGVDSLLYDPIYEIGAASNWMDGFDVGTAEVDITVETRGIAGAGAVEVKAAAAHNTTANGNKVVFMTMDPISINSSPYVWWSDSLVAPQYKALEWFGIVVGVEDESLTPGEFSLDQNYPNPFNPTTTINFSLAAKSSVSLKVYNLLGQEVMTLVDGVQNAGVHEVNFNANQLSSGVYFYTIKAGEFVSTKKMILLK